jgi:hypothetical protein
MDVPASSSNPSIRSGREAPTTVETMRVSRSENWSAAAASGTSCRRHAASIASIRASSSVAASRYP